MPAVVSPLRIGLVLILDAVALIVLASLLPGFEVQSVWAAIGMAAIMGLLNALVWPFLSRLTLPLSVLSLGLSALMLNGALILLAAAISPGVELHGFWTAVVVVVGMAAITALLSALLAIDDDESWQRNVVARQARRRGGVERSDVPGDRVLRDRRSGPRRAAARDAQRPRAATWPGCVADGRLPDRGVGDRLVVADRRVPGRPAARRQRRHPGLPLVGEGQRQADGDQPPARRRRARAAPLRRARAAARGRREPRQHPLRRRRALDADDEHRARAAAADRARLRRLLRPPLRRRPHARARHRRPGRGSASPPPPASRRRAPAHPPALVLRRRARLGGRDPARPAGGLGGRRHAQPGGPWSTPPSSPTTRWPTTRASSAPTRSRCCGSSTARSRASPAAMPDAPRPYGWSCSPTTASRRGRRSCSATA